MKCFKKACRGEKGFTLIELLVVIMILGVLAAVVTLAVTKFIGKGTLESANAEAVTVQTAVEACLANANRGSFDAPVTGWNGSGDGPKVTVAGTEYKVSEYMRTHNLKATYDISVEGVVTGKDGSGWGNIEWDSENLTWKQK